MLCVCLKENKRNELCAFDDDEDDLVCDTETVRGQKGSRDWLKVNGINWVWNVIVIDFSGASVMIIFNVLVRSGLVSLSKWTK